jgi:hypothetical protein
MCTNQAIDKPRDGLNQWIEEFDERMYEGKPWKPNFQITYRKAAPPGCKYALVEGTGPVREVVSWHKRADTAERAYWKWQAPANALCLERQTGYVWRPAEV